MTRKSDPAVPPLPRLAACVREGRPATLVLYGDSISEVGRTPGYFGGATAPECNWGPQLAGLLAARWPQTAFAVKHFAIGGQNSYEGLGRLDWLAPLAPDLVLVAFGANDLAWHALPPAATGRALEFLIDGIRHRTQADVVVVCPGGENPHLISPARLLRTIAAQRKVAAAKAVPVVDVRAAVWRLTERGVRWTDCHNGERDCHPNDRGHRAWAEAVAQAVAAGVVAAG